MKMMKIIPKKAKEIKETSNNMLTAFLTQVNYQLFEFHF